MDIVVNDLPPDIVHQLRERAALQSATSPGLDFAYVGLNMRDPVLRDRRVRQAIGYAIDRQAIVDHLRRGLARPAVGSGSVAGVGLRARRPPVHLRPGAGAGAAGRSRLSRPGRRRPAAPPAAVAEDLDQRGDAAAVDRDPADLQRVGIDLDVRSYEFATFYADVLQGHFQMFTLQWVGGALVDPDILRRVFHSTQVPPAGFNRGYYSNPGGGSR